MLKIINGDAVALFQQEPLTALGHGCNCFCKMRRGIAKTISERFPIVRQADDSTGTNRDKIGRYSLVCINNDERQYIYNLYTQYTYWDESDMLEYGGVLLSLTRALRDAKEKGVKKFFIPRIGSGLARGDKDTLLYLFGIAAKEVPEVDLYVVDYE